MKRLERQMFESLQGKRFFVTGGTGFFGKSLLDLMKKGFLAESRLTILSRDCDGFLKKYPGFAGLKNVAFVQGDVRAFSFPPGKFDIIFHGAAAAVTTLPPGEMRSVILDGTKRVLQFARNCQAEKLLFVSSGAVYGDFFSFDENISEDFPCAPVTEYGIAKLEAEKMCLNSGIRTGIARCFAFLGPRLNLDIHFAAGNFLRNCLNNEKILIKGDGTPFRSYLYADDLIEWLFAIIARGENGCIYNVGSPEAVSIRELACEMAAHFSPEPAVEIMGLPEPGAIPARYVPDVSKIRKELGVRMNFTLGEAIEACKKFHQNNLFLR
jgi:dTDP-glucose 4,6-dehydratase